MCPGSRSATGLPLSSLTSARPSTVNATRLAWTMSGTGGLSNELTVARLGERESCLPAVAYPELVVTVGRSGPRSLGAGTTEQLRRAVRQPDRLGADRQRLLDHGRPPPDPRHARRADSPRRSPQAGGRGRAVVLRRASTPWSRAWRADTSATSSAPPPAGTSADAFERSSTRSLRAGPVDARARAHAHRRPPVRRAVPADHARPGSGARVRAPGHQYGRHAQRQPPLVAPARLQL